ncbi:ribosomal protein S5 domain 2-like protein [Testicularia cyperi]|uniref:phosphomevalonate kinase n=1 Tax=Testicularia cyperi TaxID=1882483 RepID=A0A317XG48_9BASI|nr:ribosomal protein S5 domain 2-like protein [Testicularia cyperi]
MATQDSPYRPRETTVSAPGKVLIAGGYLVLDPAYPGLVVSTSSRFYCTARSQTSSSATTQAQSASESDPTCLITVRSPQFVDAEWIYRATATSVTKSDGTTTQEWLLEQTKASFDKAGRNPFVSLGLIYTLRLASEIKGFDEVESLFRRTSSQGIEITVLGDNDFYSQRETLGLKNDAAPTMDQLESLPPFTRQACRIGDVHKTGLGSSAAMTTSLVGCFLLHLQAILLTHDKSIDTEDLVLIHNLAQLAHCAAQGKVGSGFDVSAAIYGSQLYRRFEPQVLQTTLDQAEKVYTEGEQSGEESQSKLRARTELLEVLDPHNPLWKPSPLSATSSGNTSQSVNEPAHSTAVEGLAVEGGLEHLPIPAPLQLPAGLDLLLADVDAGSNTPSLVSKVLAWRKAKPDWANQLYNVIATSNQSLADGLLRLRILCASDSEVYFDTVDAAAARPSLEWDAYLKTLPDDGSQADDSLEVDLTVSSHSVLQALIDVRNSLRSIRAGMRELGVRAGVPIEPPEIGSLIKKISDEIPGVVGGSIPGAGGFDAFYIIHLQSKKKQRALSQLWDQIQDVKVKAESTLTLGPLLSRADGAKALENSAKSASAQSSESDDAMSKLLAKLRADTHASAAGGLRIENAADIRGLEAAWKA